MSMQHRATKQRLTALEGQAARASTALAVLVAIGKEPEQVAAELAELERRLPVGQVVIVVDR